LIFFEVIVSEVHSTALQIAAATSAVSAQRFALLQKCTLHFRGVCYEAFAEDISTTGLCLTNAPTLMLKQPVEIQLKGGRHLSGTVVWAQGGKVGLQFVTPLPLTDPLLAGQLRRSVEPRA